MHNSNPLPHLDRPINLVSVSKILVPDCSSFDTASMLLQAT